MSSYRAGNYQEELVGLFGKDTKVGVITNAKDYKPLAERRASVEQLLDYFKKMGLKPTELDLRKYFYKPADLENELKKYPNIWVAGGNTFVVRRALRYSGADRWLYDLVRKNEVVYGGESAGSIIATPSLQGAEFGDDPNVIPDLYKSQVIWNALDFVAFHIVPHYQSVWSGIEAEAMLDHLKKNQTDYRTLRDGQAILINGNKEDFLS